MNKTAIKNFSIWARNKLIEDITYKAGLIGVSEKGIAQPLSQSTKDLQFFDIGTKDYAQVAGKEIEQRNGLVKVIKEKERDLKYADAFKAVIEEIAYTWFNRLVAIRFMEVNDYLPSRVRVLSSENPAKNEPDFVTTPFDTDLEFTPAEQDRIMQLKDENKLDELFRMLFIKQCNKLHEILPDMFEKTNDYTELLLTISFTDKEGFVCHLVNDIAEDNRQEQVEIIGWLYQYYISEKHEEVVNVLGKKSVKKDDIPAATQLFTTDWVVRYMVDNSLGRYWVERHPESNLAEKLDFFVKSKNRQIQYINEKIEPQELTFFDPCMGSGHILVYAFDVLMEIYRECGYADRDAVSEIMQHNLFGVDIDDRCSQLAYFALIMKARSYDRRFLSREIKPNVMAIQESNGISSFGRSKNTPDASMNKIGEDLIDVFRHAKEIGSLQTVERRDYAGFKKYLTTCVDNAVIDIEFALWQAEVLPVIEKLASQADILSKKYAVVCTNPPYLNKMEGHLKDFVVDRYKPYSGDLFSVFMYRNFGFCKDDGYSAFMTPNVWMFIKSYEQLREYIIKKKSVSTLIQMAKGAFYREATVDVCSFVLRNQGANKYGTFIRLEDFKGDMDVQKKALLDLMKANNKYIFAKDIREFLEIEGMPFAYWISDITASAFKLPTTIGKISPPKQGLATADNDRFLRLWFEVDIHNIGFGCTDTASALRTKLKWFPYNKGGAYRRWFGNREYVVNWENDGSEIKNFRDENGKVRSRPQNIQYYFKPAITWSDTTSASFSGRYAENGFIFDIKGSSGFPNENDLPYVLGLLNSCVSQEFIRILNPTITTQVGDMARIPVALKAKRRPEVERMVLENVQMARDDWNSFEFSWEFKRHPLVRKHTTIREAFAEWETECEERFAKVKANEEELNKIFIDIYGLSDELLPDVEDKNVTIRKADLSREIRSLLSYAIGCMFGRYSLDEDGLIYAGGKFASEKYNLFIPDKDNVIPINDEPYFEDDIVGLLCRWLQKVYGQTTLEENLDYIAHALGNKGATSREIISNYFLNDFFKDHCATYSVTGSGKRPIYWLFDSGKQNGFKALVYMHRWDADSVGNLRVEYLHKMQHTYEREIQRMQETIDDGRDSREVSKATKRKDKLQKQLKETKDYDAMLAHIALSRIEIDLDDGVKVNYEKVQTGRDGKKMQILAKI